VQYRIEEIQEDLDKYLIFSDNTRLSKGTSISVVFKNMLTMYAYKHDHIIGNTVFLDIHEPLPGAIVADPALIEVLGQEILNKPSYVFNWVIDLDIKSEYPTIMIIFNIFKDALFGRAMKLMSSRGKELGSAEPIMKHLVTIDTSLFDLCEIYMGLPGPNQVFKIIEKLLNTKL